MVPTPHDAPARRFVRKAKSVRVLVISPSGFVRLAIAHRLADLDAVVTLSVEGGDFPFDDYDAVIVGPYLDEADRDKVIDDLTASGSHAAVIEICDPPENGSARLIALGDNRLADTAQHLLAAVGDTHGALATQ
jgi:hypothetical protein